MTSSKTTTSTDGNARSRTSSSSNNEDHDSIMSILRDTTRSNRNGSSSSRRTSSPMTGSPSSGPPRVRTRFSDNLVGYNSIFGGYTNMSTLDILDAALQLDESPVVGRTERLRNHVRDDEGRPTN